MTSLEVKEINEADSSIYARSTKSKLIDAPSSPPLTVKAMQMVSGRRKGFQAKNDSAMESATEKKISARMSLLDGDELKPLVKVLEPAPIDNEAKLSSSRRRRDNNSKTINGQSDVVQLNSNLRQAYGDQLTSIMISPPAPRKDLSNRRAVSSDRPLPSYKRDKDEVEVINSSHRSPEATRRSPPVSKNKSESKSMPKAKPASPQSENKDRVRLRAASPDKPKASGNHVKSGDVRADRPNSPHRVKHNVKVKGRKVIPKESSDTPSDASSRSIGSTTSEDVTSRREIQSRKQAIEKKISENYKDGEFQDDDDEDLKFAIEAALDANKQNSIREAIEEGHELNAQILKSVTRPNAIEEVIEAMVSQRREKVKRSKKRAQPKSSEPAPFRPNRTKAAPVKPAPKPTVVDEESSEEEPDIETMEEPQSERPRPVLEKRPFSVADGSPKQPAMEEEPTEQNVKLPKGDRRRVEAPDELGQQDLIYDPLGVDKPFDHGDEDVGDDIYEESSEEDEKLTIDEKKDEMLYRFKLIKETYPNIALPRITKKMKLAKMIRMFEHVMSRVKLKVKTRNFQIFLAGGMLMLQMAAKKFGLDASGFVFNQMYSMKRYDAYLREIGESDFSSIGSELPLFIRLPGFILVNFGIFVLAKYIFKATGKNVTDQFYKLYAQLTGGDDYVYVKDESGNGGLDTEAEAGSGGIMGLLKPLMSMFGGGFGGGGGGGGNADGEAAPARGQAPGATYKRRRPRDTA